MIVLCCFAKNKCIAQVLALGNHFSPQHEEARCPFPLPTIQVKPWGFCAQVLALGDPFIPRHEEPPRRGAVPVRFFGTYDFAWIESQRALAPLAGRADDPAAKCKTQARARVPTSFVSFSFDSGSERQCLLMERWGGRHCYRHVCKFRSS